ncbi:MAG: zinc ribbon domain-containing protein [Chloroflexota bacterium]
MATLVVALMVLAALVVIGLPLYRAAVAGAASEPAPAAAGGKGLALGELVTQRDATFRAIKEIEFDFQVGNLSAADFSDLRERYKARALQLIRTIRELEEEQRSETSEQAAPSVPAVLPAAKPEDDPIELAVARKRQTRQVTVTCLSCGQPCRTDAKFCGNCGALLAVCAACSEVNEPHDKFCVRCGAPLGLPASTPARAR